MSKEDTNFEIVPGTPFPRGELDSLWLLYSHKRAAWYAPFHHGYADALILAGTYSEEEAKAENKKYPHVEPRRLADVLHYYETFDAEPARRMNSLGGKLGIFRRLSPLAIVDDRTQEQKERDGDS
jgi:hypothetical protein